jgi:poly-gamma-glutamate synthesis protein (capsule biosynthesis protein)
VDAAGRASLRLEVDQHPVSQWVFALVAPFPTISDGLSAQAIKHSWRGESSGPFGGEPLLLDESTYRVFSAWWGEPAPEATKALPANELVDYAWDHQPSWALVPFEALQPRWKVLEVDGQSPLRKEFDLSSYPLSVPISLNSEENLVQAALSLETEEYLAAWDLPASNRDAGRLTTLNLTGVTAMVRATAFTMHRKGVTYPAQDIGELLRDADLTHISNEIPFTPDCPPPNPTQEGLVFCSDPDYIGLLEEVGTDIVELTGDHFGDWGPEAMYYTLDMYTERDWIYYGGGSDRKDARQARLIEHNGNRLAFIGCNAKGGGYATASASQPGAVACDFDWMAQEIARLREDGYLVIATFQHFEYYTYQAQPDQVEDFHRLAKAGAMIVSGSQAHQPQGMEFFKTRSSIAGLGTCFSTNIITVRITPATGIHRPPCFTMAGTSLDLMP